MPEEKKTEVLAGDQPEKAERRERFGDDCRAWASVAVELLEALDDRELADVLLGAGRPEQKFLLDRCGLLSIWKRHPSRTTAAALVVQPLRKALSEQRHKITSVAAGLLLTWWVREAEERLEKSSLWPHLRGLDLADRYARCHDLLPWADADLQADLKTGPESANSCGRLFSTIARATIDRWTADEIKSRAATDTVLRLSGRTADENPESQKTQVPEDDSLKELPAAKPGGASSGLRISEVVSPSASRATLGLAAVEAALRACVKARRDMQRLMGADVGRLQALVREIEQAEKNAADMVGGLSQEHGFPAGTIPGDALLDEAALGRFVANLHELVQERYRRESEALEARRKQVCEELEQLGVTPPPALANAHTVAEVNAARASVEPAVRLERAFRQFSGTKGAALEGLAPGERVELFERAVQSQMLEPPELLSLLLDDPATLGDPDLSRALLKFILEKTLESGASLPAGTWATVLRSRGAVEATALAEAAVVLARGDVRRLDPDGVGLLASGPASPDLERFQQRVEILKLAPAQRVQPAAALLLDRDLDAEILDDLAVALLESSRYSEALALIVFGLLAGHEAKIPERRIKDALVAALLSYAKAGPQGVEIVRSLIADQRWLLAPEDVPVLVFLADSIGEAPVVAQAFPAEWEEARRQRPALMDSLFAPQQRPLPKHDVLAAQTALAELRHDLEKRSCYANWLPATEYQEEFKLYLGELLRGLNRPEGTRLSPDDLIAAAQSARHLDIVEGRAMRAMRSYLEEQYARIDTLREALSGEWACHNVDAELSRRARDPRSELESERQVKATTPALLRLYELVQER